MAFDIPIFIINLKQDVDKKEHMKSLCSKYKLNCNFIEAVYGKDLDDQAIANVYDENEALRVFKRSLTKGEIGCALSHLSIYQKIVDQNIEKAIIFEDDIEIYDGFFDVIESIEKFPNDWELVLLGYHQKIIRKYFCCQLSLKDKYRLVRLSDIHTGAHAYLINFRGAKRLLSEAIILNQPIDHYTGDSKFVNLYGCSPRVVNVHNILSKVSSLTTDRNKISKIKYPVYQRVFREIVKKPYVKYIKPFLNPPSYK